LIALDARGVEVPEHFRFRVGACPNRQTLGDWLKRAAVATCLDDLSDS
jgi:hypothetical protein